MRHTQLGSMVAATALASCLLAVTPLAGASAATTVAAQASVSFPVAVPPATMQRLAALARTSGHGAARAAVVRALAPPDSQAQAIVRWAGAHGFRVVSRSAWLVEVRGRADDLAAALGTTATTATVHGRRFPLATGRLRVPAGLLGVVGTPVGLDERPAYRHSSTFGGGDLQVMQNLPVRGGGAGADVTVGTLNLSGWHPADLTAYATAYGLRVPAVTSVVVGSGHVAATAADDASGGVGEVSLDAEAIAGTAPAAAQRMYFGGNTDADYLAILSQMADDASNGLLQTASTSWGLCESSVTATEQGLEAAQIDRMVAAGTTFFAASGDSGSFGCSTPGTPDGTLDVDWPAAEANTVGVGGVSQGGDASAGYGTPAAWGQVQPAPAAGTYAGAGSGGGCSSSVPEPGYQLNKAAVPGETVPTCWSAASPQRAVPDMAALADPSTGYAVFDSTDGWMVMGGTSLAAPLSAAGLADFLSSQPDKHGVGNILPVAYQHPGAFTDVTSGSNGSYAAGTGYDLVTGLGVPDWSALGAALRSVTVTPEAPSSNPLFLAPDAWNSLTVPYFQDLNGGHLASPGVRQDDNHGGSACPTTPALPVTSDPTFGPSFALDPATPDGAVTVTLTGSDPTMGCRATTRTVLLDRSAPTATASAAYTGTTGPRFALSWAYVDPAPSSGLDSFAVKVSDQTTGVVRVDVPTTLLRTASLPAVAGHLYLLQVQALDRAGNASPWRSVSFRAPYDDRSASLSSGWSRVSGASDYLGSHVLSARAGSSLTLRFTGTSLTLGVLKSRYGGYADVYVDGVKRSRLSLYASSTLYRQQIRVAAFTTSGSHLVVVKVVGAHPVGSLGNYVYLDSYAVG